MALSCLLTFVASTTDSFAKAPEFRFEHAEFVVSDAKTPPDGGWQPQALPDSWRHNHPGLAGIAWYRMRFDLDAVPAEPMALYVARAVTTGQFRLNGIVLNPDVRFSDPDGSIGDDTWRWPHLITLPTGLLRAGENVLHVRLQASPVGGHGLWDVRIGSLEQLRGPWLVREVPQRTLPQALFVLMLAGLVFGFLVWWRDRRGRNLHFTAVMSLWTVIVGLWVLPPLPVNARGASVLLTSLYIVFYWALLALIYRYSESTWRWYPWVLSIVSGLTLVAALVVQLTGNTQDSPQYTGLVMSSTVLLRLLATVMLLQAAWRSRLPRAYALAATEVLWFAGHVQLIAILAGWVQPAPFRLEPAGALPLYLVLLYFFIEELIREREQAIRDQHAAVATERGRLLQDMHDGMGSQLVTALRLAQREGGDPALVAHSIADALQDLRLIIDSLDASEHGLTSMLANLRYRLEPRLAALGIRLEWRVDARDDLMSTSPHTALGVLRIVQEALNNALKHAQPRAITVSLTHYPNESLIAVADDGVGFDPAAIASSGRGLSGMHKRAEALGGALRVLPQAGGGTCVTLHLPAASKDASGIRGKIAGRS